MTVRTADTPYVCGWSMDDTCCTRLASAFADEDTAARAQACVDQAAEILYGLSGRQFGTCEVTLRPCRRDCEESAWLSPVGYPWIPQLIGGEWRNVRCGRCTSDCSCTEVCELVLPGPVDSVTEVKLNGNVLVEGQDYRVDNWVKLVALNECWPKCQDMNLADTEEGTFSVTYLRGLALPVAGQAAFEAFACELSKACFGDTSCVLPARVTEVVRAGITMTMLDSMDFLDKGLTGIYAVDIWLKSINPKGRSRRAHVFSPDVEPTRRQTSGSA